MKYLSLTLFAISIFFPTVSYGAPKYYVCQVLSDAHIKNSGELDLLRNSSRIGQQFSVDKNTGEVNGDIFDALGKPEVIAHGGNQNSFKVIWKQKAAGKDGVFLDYLSIEEFAKNTKKPFGFFSGGLLITGICE